MVRRARGIGPELLAGLDRAIRVRMLLVDGGQPADHLQAWSARRPIDFQQCGFDQPALTLRATSPPQMLSSKESAAAAGVFPAAGA
jgi:hypothetical protein